MSSYRPVRSIIRRAQARCEKEGYVLKKEALGEGQFGVVYEGTHERYGSVALKVVSPDEDLQEYVVREIELQRSFDHPNIVRIFDAIVEDDFCIIVMEKCDSSLTDLAKSYTDIVPEDHLRQIFHDIISGLAALAKRNLVHRDIKDDNVLLKKDPRSCYGYVAKLADFGFVKEASETQTQVGTPLFEAPEIITGRGRKKYGCEVDMWSVGIMLDIFIEGIHTVIRRKRTCGRDNPAPDFTIAEKDRKGYSPALFDLLFRILEKDPRARISAPEALRHEWFRPIARRMVPQVSAVFDATIRLIFFGAMERARILCESNCVFTAEIPYPMIKPQRDTLTWEGLWKFAKDKNLFDVKDNRTFNEMGSSRLSFYYRTLVCKGSDRIADFKAIGGLSHDVYVFSSSFELPTVLQAPKEKSHILRKMFAGTFKVPDRRKDAQDRHAAQQLKFYSDMFNFYRQSGYANLENYLPRIEAVFRCCHQMGANVNQLCSQLQSTFSSILALYDKLNGVLPADSDTTIPYLEFPEDLRVDVPHIQKYVSPKGEFHLIADAAYQATPRFLNSFKARGAVAKDYTTVYDKCAEFAKEAACAVKTYEDLIDVFYEALAGIMRDRELLLKLGTYKENLEQYKKDVEAAVTSPASAKKFVRNAANAVSALNTQSRNLVANFVVISPCVSEYRSGIGLFTSCHSDQKRIHELEARIKELEGKLSKKK